MRRKYISLASTILFIVLFLLNIIPSSSESTTLNPNDSNKHLFEYPLVPFQIVSAYLVFRTKSNDTKNILTCLNVMVTVIYMLTFFYFLLLG